LVKEILVMDEPTGLAEGNQTTTQKVWTDDIPTEYRDAVAKKGWTGHDSFYKSYFELEKTLGTRVKIPGGDAPPEEKSAFYAKMGRPDTPDGYQIARPENLPEGMRYDETLEGTVRTAAHELGLSQNQLNTLAKIYNDYQVKAYTTRQDELARERLASETQLKGEWKENYDANVQVAHRGMKELVPAELREKFIGAFDEKGLGNHPDIIRGFFEIGKKILNDTFVKGEGQGAEEGYVPANPKSPEMYAYGDDEDSKKSRAWFRAHQNYKYDRDD
jgi:hypothetical protein